MRIEPTCTVGRQRWALARTVVLLRRFRRLTIRDERRQDIQAAFLTRDAP